VEVEDRLTAAWADIDEHPVVVQPSPARRLGDEGEHPFGLLRWEGVDVPERVDVALREDEQVRLRLRIDVADRDEAVGLRQVIALVCELTEEALVRQRGSPPP
jgi:hypothetical protein